MGCTFNNGNPSSSWMVPIALVAKKLDKVRNNRPKKGRRLFEEELSATKRNVSPLLKIANTICQT